MKRIDLPISSYRSDIVNSVKKHATTIIVGETGSGKSTQLPQYLIELVTNKKGKIACTQPRRIAAVSIAQRVSSERSKPVGTEIGYSIRFEDRTSSETKVKFLTDGVLLRECIVDPLLQQYDIVILDEAHERSLQTDILIGLLKQLQQKRPTLRLVVMSATLQIETYKNYFQDTNVILIPGRQYPVDVYYTYDPVDDYVDAALLTCLQIHEQNDSYQIGDDSSYNMNNTNDSTNGHQDHTSTALSSSSSSSSANTTIGGVLVFLPGQEDIEALSTLLEEHLPSIVSTRSRSRSSSSSHSSHHIKTSLTSSSSSSSATTSIQTSSNLIEAHSYNKKRKLSSSNDTLESNDIHIIGENDNNDDDDDEDRSNQDQTSPATTTNTTTTTATTTRTLKPVVTANNLKDYKIFPLYASMSAEDQLQVFAPVSPHIRKFILSTNIAETSLTLSGIKYVVDTGYVKSRLLQPNTGMEMLKVVPVSKAQANQRAGRAGRECPGTCYRLYTEHTYEDLDDVTIPEIQRVNISQVILQLKAIGVESPIHFPYISPPSMTSLRSAFEVLLSIQALSKDQQLTEQGRKMVQLPLDPIYAHLLLQSIQFRCVSEILTLVSLLSSENVFILPYREEQKKLAGLAHRRFASKHGDLPTLLHVYNSWIQTNKDKNWASRNYLSQRSLLHTESIRKQLESILIKMKIDTTVTSLPEREPYLKCLASGLFLNTARLVLVKNNKGIQSAPNSWSQNSTKFSNHQYSSNKSIPVLLAHSTTSEKDNDTSAPYKTIKDHLSVHIHPSSVLFSNIQNHKLPPYVVYSELLTTSKRYMRGITAIDSAWLTQLVPHQFQQQQQQQQKQPSSIQYNTDDSYQIMK